MKSLLTNMLLCLCLISSSLTFSASSGGSDYDVGSEPKEYKLAVAAVDEQDYPKAISHLDQLVKKDAKNADAYNLLGYSHRKLKNYETAERYYNKALALTPNHKGALEYLGELYIETQRMDLAKAQLAKLDKACWFGCKEYDLLKARIESAGGKL